MDNNMQFLDDIRDEVLDAADSVFEDEGMIDEDINEEDDEAEKSRAQEFFKEGEEIDEGNKVTAYQLFMSEDEPDEPSKKEIKIKINTRLHADAPWPAFSEKKINEKNFEEELRCKYYDCSIQNGNGYVEWESQEEPYHTAAWEDEIKRAFAANGLPAGAKIYCKFGSRDTGYIEEFELDADADSASQGEIDEDDTSAMEGNDPLFMEYFGHA